MTSPTDLLLPYRTTLTTSRLTIKLLDLRDSTSVAAIIATYNTPEFARFGFSSIGIRTPADLEQKCQKHRAKPHLCTALSQGSMDLPNIFHTVHTKATGEYIGFMVMNFRNEASYPDLGYCFLEAFHGQGYAAEAGREYLRFWTNEVGVQEVCVNTFDNNFASQKLAEKIGFVFGGPLVLDFANGVVNHGKMFILPGMKRPVGAMSINPNIARADGRDDPL